MIPAAQISSLREAARIAIAPPKSTFHRDPGGREVEVVHLGNPEAVLEFRRLASPAVVLALLAERAKLLRVARAVVDSRAEAEAELVAIHGEEDPKSAYAAGYGRFRHCADMALAALGTMEQKPIAECSDDNCEACDENS